jgi:hypothetical protein
MFRFNKHLSLLLLTITFLGLLLVLPKLIPTVFAQFYDDYGNFHYQAPIVDPYANDSYGPIYYGSNPEFYGMSEVEMDAIYKENYDAINGAGAWEMYSCQAFGFCGGSSYTSTSGQFPTSTTKCEQSAYVFLIDVSPSMQRKSIWGTTTLSPQPLRNALKQFGTTIDDETVIGLTTFASIPTEILPIEKMKTLRSKYNAGVDKIITEPANSTDPDDGVTNAKDAFFMTQQKLEEAQQKYPTFKFNLILVSDGIFSPNQDPTQPVDIASQIKAMGISIHTLGISDGLSSGAERYVLGNITSVPNTTYYYSVSTCGGLLCDLLNGTSYSASAEDYLDIFNQIYAKPSFCPPESLPPVPPLCQEQRQTGYIFFIDDSGSMAPNPLTGTPDKMAAVKVALQDFGTQLPDDMVVGIQTFSDGNSPSLAPGKIREIRQEYKTTIAGITPYGTAMIWTSLPDIQETVQDAITKYPNYDFKLIIITDGTNSFDLALSSTTQSTYIQPLKDQDVDISTIGIYDSEATDNSAYKTLLTEIASTPSEGHVFSVDDSRLIDISGILSLLYLQSCEDLAVASNTGSISGCVFVDTNGDGVKNSGEQNYSGTPDIRLSPAAGTLTSPVNGCYQIDNVPFNNYLVRNYSVPDGFSSTFPLVASTYQVTLNNPLSSVATALGACQISPVNGVQACSNGTITELNFGITDQAPWIQAVGANIRDEQNGVINPVPAGSACGTVAIRDGNGGSPGLVYTGTNPSSFGQGTASSKNWIVDGDASVFTSTDGLRSSYRDTLQTLKRNSKTPIPLADYCNTANCTITDTIGSEPYAVQGNVTLNNVTITSKKVVLLVDGEVTITQNVTVTPGATFTVIATGNIFVRDTVGAAPNAYACPGGSSELDGIFVTNGSFIVEGGAACPEGDRQLHMAGSVVTNADTVNGGNVTNNRTLCANNARYPAFTMQPRLDMLLNTPDYMMRPSTSWREVAP